MEAKKGSVDLIKRVMGAFLDRKGGKESRWGKSAFSRADTPPRMGETDEAKSAHSPDFMYVESKLVCNCKIAAQWLNQWILMLIKK